MKTTLEFNLPETSSCALLLLFRRRSNWDLVRERDVSSDYEIKIASLVVTEHRPPDPKPAQAAAH